MGSNLYVAASGAKARLQQLSIVANNLANTESKGFKADRAIFESALESALGLQGEATPGASSGVYVRMSETGSVHAPGPIRRTGAPLDVALEGGGFFVVETPQGERYTRAGAFSIDSEKQLVTAAGNPVVGERGTIDVSGSGIQIRGSGEIVNARGTRIGRLRVVDFPDPSRLTKAGDSLFVAPDDMAPEDIDAPRIVEGSLEGSNVAPVVEMATMMILQRAFDASMQVMQREDQATERLIQEISR